MHASLGEVVSRGKGGENETRGGAKEVDFVLKSKDFFLGFLSLSCLDLSFLKGICCHSVARLK